MTVQPVSNNNQYVSALTSDFKNVQDDIKALETAQSTGNKDQITLSQEALKKVMTQFQNDIASLTQGTQATQGHHHHHHHKTADAANANTSSSDTTGSTIASLAAFSAYGSSGVQTKSNASSLNLTA